MLQYLSEIDTNLLLAINSWHTPALDQLMFLLSSKLVWIPFYILLLIVSIHRYGWRGGMFIAVGIALAVTIADQTCASLIRPLVERMRPTNPNNPISELIHTVNGYHGGRYGFPSCHAANTVAVATFLSLVFRHRALIIFSLALWTAMNCYSRMYLGVHYPGDIVVGGIIGFVTGYSTYHITLSAIFWFIDHKPQPSSDLFRISTGYSILPEIRLSNSVLLMAGVLITTFVLLTISLFSY
ncbi:MAG: phosphatase PAP2 family protein [Muribaculum sp.]|nr:phosphatase PAP2 family protein [Muribaculaceae bacterium]MCM1081220.1 phosphatase PAP2 family protein [Muribaculum sp.]